MLGPWSLVLGPWSLVLGIQYFNVPVRRTAVRSARMYSTSPVLLMPNANEVMMLSCPTLLTQLTSCLIPRDPEQHYVDQPTKETRKRMERPRADEWPARCHGISYLIAHSIMYRIR